jgi:succinate dehydrogenase/fumarate reductase-like Fe-S protein
MVGPLRLSAVDCPRVDIPKEYTSTATPSSIYRFVFDERDDAGKQRFTMRQIAGQSDRHQPR